MQANELTRERLRDLAATRPGGKVLSLFVNLDPREFAAPPAKETQVRSVLDRAAAVIREDEALSQDDRKALRDVLDGARERLVDGLDGQGAHGLAVYAGDGLFEVVKLPQPVEHEPVVAEGPFIEPLAELSHGERWAVLLVNRRMARLFEGGIDGLQEVAGTARPTKNQHSQGGWSQARYERSVEREKEWHFDDAATLAFEVLHDELPDGLILGGPSEVVADFEHGLHPYLRARLAGRIDVDVENTGPDAVHAAAAPLIEARAQQLVEEALDRLRAGLGRPDGRAVAGLDAVLEALHERRVEHLLVDAGYHPAGTVCPSCEMLHAEGVATCPADGTATEAVPDVLEAAMERAIGQDAEVRILRDRPDLGPHGHIAATLRF
jgi:peptide chain release factor subunit 1